MVVVGSGVGAMASALAAAEAGMTVAVLEKNTLPGGGTAFFYEGFWAGCDRIAKAVNISDSREAVLDYMNFVARGCANEELLATFIDQASIAFESLSAAESACSSRAISPIFTTPLRHAPRLTADLSSRSRSLWTNGVRRDYGIGYQAGYSLAAAMTFGHLAVRCMERSSGVGGGRPN